MSKISMYLNEHLSGEVISSGREMAEASVDGSVLLQRPELIARVAGTSDIRKIARFCWQLAEKGHTLAMTARGHGSDGTGGAVGAGISLSAGQYMYQILGIDLKQRLIHVQAGAPYAGVVMALSTHRGLTLPYPSFDGMSGTIGGAIASGAAGRFARRYGTVGGAVKQLEVVLANGDVLQTGRLSKREWNAKMGLHTMEGEVYRQIDHLLMENKELIARIKTGPRFDTAGYPGIARVRQKDGSIDLTPLFVGSQGSLGIISEVIMKADLLRPTISVVRAAYDSFADAQAAADTAVAAQAASVELLDGALLQRAAERGKVREFAPKEAFAGGLVVAMFDDFNERSRQRTAKKLQKALEKQGGTVHLSTQDYTIAELADVTGLLTVAAQSDDVHTVTPAVFRGMWLPGAAVDTFLKDVRGVEDQLGVALPVWIDVTRGFMDMLPLFDMKKVSDRQKVLKLLAALAELVAKHGGTMAGHGGDGKLKTFASQTFVPEDVATLYAEIKQIFDPHDILNPGTKQSVVAKELAAQLNAWCREA